MLALPTRRIQAAIIAWPSGVESIPLSHVGSLVLLRRASKSAWERGTVVMRK